MQMEIYTLAQIAQIQMSYSPLEDRILLRLGTDTRSELRFWITRRYAGLLRPKLDEITRQSGRGAMIADDATRRVVSDFEREAALEKADFEAPFQESPESLPLGDSPVLLARLVGKQNDAGQAVIGLLPIKGAGIDMAMDNALAHSFGSLLERTLAASGWLDSIAEVQNQLAPNARPEVLN
jgi:hypothetical protein